jgi:hypothetical protein
MCSKVAQDWVGYFIPVRIELDAALLLEDAGVVL